YLLAIAGGLRLAAERGLPAVAGGPLLDDAAALAAYARDFRPARADTSPNLVVSVEVVVADTAEQARELLLPEAWAFADSRDVGEFRPLRPVEEVHRLLAGARPKKVEAVQGWMRSAVAGTPEQVRARLEELVERTGASEVLASVSAVDRADVARTDEVLASLRAG
ncbi:LLM class flavin-dependent oxidoreductase, partial [Desertihabitans aurantiacus]|uniref:LLM class flavin-dependent oxidoreductase n=1 Tax=Desertihabitans aurantiacus TaxID=2282477 RepID=UPI000DF77464